MATRRREIGDRAAVRAAGERSTHMSDLKGGGTQAPQAATISGSSSSIGVASRPGSSISPLTKHADLFGSGQLGASHRRWRREARQRRRDGGVEGGDESVDETAQLFLDSTMRVRRHATLTIRNPSISLTTGSPFHRSMSCRTTRRPMSPPSSLFILSMVFNCSQALSTALLSGM